VGVEGFGGGKLSRRDVGKRWMEAAAGFCDGRLWRLFCQCAACAAQRGVVPLSLRVSLMDEYHFSG
jgi:hypothetical protein